MIMKAWMSKFCFLWLTFCAQRWLILCIMFLSFRKDQPCGAWAFGMFFCWHVTQLSHWLLVNGATVERIQASLHICTLTRFFNPHIWSMSRCRFTHLTRSGGGTRSPDIFISVPLPFQQWNVSSTGLQNWNKFGATSQFMQNCQSVIYWSTKTEFESYTCIVLQACTPYDNAWVREHLLISSWQPAVNHPFVLKFLKLKSEGWMMQVRKKSQGPVKLSPRLYQRVRRRLFSLGPVPSPHSFQEQAWRILYQISLFTRASYDAGKRIRSGQFHTLEVYSLYRLATHMEEPGRSRVKSLIGKALLFRNATVPKNSLPLHIPFLAHDNFRTNLETWIRQLILQ